MRVLIAIVAVVLLASCVSAEKKQEFEAVGIPPMTYKQALKIVHEMMVARVLNASSTCTKDCQIHLKGLPCWLCTKAIGWLIGKGNDWTCGFAFDALALAACEAAGLGPEDPLSEVCTAALIGGCTIILKDIEDHITSPQQICSDIDLC